MDLFWDSSSDEDDDVSVEATPLPVDVSKIDGSCEDGLRLRQSQLRKEMTAEHIGDVVNKLKLHATTYSSKSASRDAAAPILEKPSLCLATSTRASLGRHVTSLKTMFEASHKYILDSNESSLNKKRRLELQKDGWNFAKMYVDSMTTQTNSRFRARRQSAASEPSTPSPTADSSTPMHSVIWLHGSPSCGKQSWVEAFWSGCLSIPVHIWNPFDVPTMSLPALCSSMRDFFQTCVATHTGVSSLLFSKSSSSKPGFLIPVVLRNINDAFEFLEEPSKRSKFAAFLCGLFYQFASASNAVTVSPASPRLVIYVTSSNRSCFEQRELMNTLNVYEGGRFIKFNHVRSEERMDYLNRLSLVPVADRPRLFSNLSMLSQLLDFDETKHSKGSSSSVPSSNQLSNHNHKLFALRESLSDMVHQYRPANPCAASSIVAWLRGFDMHITTLFNSDSLLHNNLGVAVMPGAGKLERTLTTAVSVMPSSNILSLLIWPSEYDVDRESHAQLFMRACSEYGAVTLVSQMMKNRWSQPTSKIAMRSAIGVALVSGKSMQMRSGDNQALIGLRDEMLHLLAESVNLSVGIYRTSSKLSQPLMDLFVHLKNPELTVSNTSILWIQLIHCICHAIWLCSGTSANVSPTSATISWL